MPGPSSQTAIVVVGPPLYATQPHAAVGRRVADRVVEQVGEHLLEALGVAGRLERRSGRPRSAAAPRARRARTPAPRARAARARRSARARAAARPTRAARGRAAARRGARGAASARASSRARASVLDAVGEVLEHRLERADRRAQLVRDVGDEVAPLPLDVGEVGRHRVEGARELAHLVARRRGHAPLVVAAGHRRGGRGHLAQRRGHAAREALDEREADHEGDHDAQPRREPELVARTRGSPSWPRPRRR